MTEPLRHRPAPRRADQHFPDRDRQAGSLAGPGTPARDRPPRGTAGRLLAAASVLLLATTACTATPPGGGSSGSGTGTASSGASGTDETAGTGEAHREPTPLEAALAAPEADVREAAAQAVDAMNVEEQAGQVLVGQLGAAGTDPASIRGLNLGGVIVMGDAVPVAADGTHDVDALASRIEETQEALGEGRDWSGIVSVDQEGGLVARVQEPLTEWPTPMSYGAAAAGAAGAGGGSGAGVESGAAGLAARGHHLLGADLAELGFTMDFAPSIDVTSGESDPTIGARSFSSDPEVVAALGAAATNGLLHAGVLPSPKHFPGHGSVTADSHVTAPVQEAGVEELRTRDWRPFAALLAGGPEGGDPAGGGATAGTSVDEGAGVGTMTPAYTPMVMMGHLVVPELEPDVPSSVSAPAYEALRRLALPTAGSGEGGGDAAGESTGEASGDPAVDSAGYDGVVVTDALNMGALVERYGPDEAPVRALAAGADLLLMPSSVPGARDAIVAAVESGEVPAERLEEAARRVVTMLLWRDRLASELEAAGPEEVAEGLAAASGSAGAGSPGRGSAPAGSAGQSAEDAESATAGSTGSASPSAEDSASAGEGSAGAGSGGQDPAAVSREVSAAAVTIVEGTCGEPLVEDALQVTGGDARDRHRLEAAAREAGLTVGSGPVVNLVGSARGAGRGDVVVALDAPFGLAQSSLSTGGALIALYGRTPGAFAALVDVLRGEAEAPGALPVEVGEWPAGTGC